MRGQVSGRAAAAFADAAEQMKDRDKAPSAGERGGCIKSSFFLKTSSDTTAFGPLGEFCGLCLCLNFSWDIWLRILPGMMNATTWLGLEFPCWSRSRAAAGGCFFGARKRGSKADHKDR